MQITRSMSCYHMLRAAFVFLAQKTSPLTTGICLAAAADAAEAVAEFVGGGQPVLLDETLAVNVLARVSASALVEVLVCVCVYIYLYLHVYVHICIYMYVCMSASALAEVLVCV